VSSKTKQIMTVTATAANSENNNNNVIINNKFTQHNFKIKKTKNERIKSDGCWPQLDQNDTFH